MVIIVISRLQFKVDWGAPFNKIPLKICIIRAESVTEMEMDMHEDFIDIFTEEPKAENFHFTVYPK